MSISDSIKGLEDKVFYDEKDGNVTITATIDMAKLEKAGKTIDYFATIVGDSVYNASTTFSFTSWLFGDKGNTKSVNSNKDKYIANCNIYKSGVLDGILRGAYDTGCNIEIDKKTGSVKITYTNDKHKPYANRAAANGCGAFGDLQEYLVSNKPAAAPVTPEAGAKPTAPPAPAKPQKGESLGYLLELNDLMPKEDQKGFYDFLKENLSDLYMVYKAKSTA